VIAHISAMTHHTGLYALSLFRYEELVFEAQKLRLIDAFVHPHDAEKKRAAAEIMKREDLAALPKVERTFIGLAQRVSGFFNVMHTIRDGFLGPEYDRGYPELYPAFSESEAGEVFLRAYGKLDPARPLAKDLKSLPPTG
jgi:hypothetical protein